ncbi:hypothetical protein EIN_163080 [Entamoeba invadens IP1]|uniref:Kinase n=1 Tax=Entamoeba invadens IP1 TaxID=370355 RepID=L7FKN4_ENTIV|nr:hypothetical protein EIN_163080 [Entamoeba invadens IP1]ELP85877.1 hypothetical protein EIN_163080 [Entamoeba invadens IP1]|eukprot:XP_004185223.1 hypothetical protein EIN_163080 [Entamoeba invadens IP1]
MDKDITIRPFHKGFLQAGGTIEKTPLVPNGKYLYKQLCSQREKAFYEEIVSLPEWHSTGVVPSYYGIEKHDFGKGVMEYLKINNMLFNCHSPFVLDLKVGTQTWKPNATEAKIIHKQHKSELLNAEHVGLRFCGMKRTIGDQVYSYDRELSEDEVIDRTKLKEMIRLFLFDGKKYEVEKIKIFDEKINRIIKAIDTKKFKFFGASVLLVYDADQKNINEKTDLRLIDFCYAWSLERESCQEEDGVKFGLENLKIILGEIREEVANKKN